LNNSVSVETPADTATRKNPPDGGFFLSIAQPSAAREAIWFNLRTGFISSEIANASKAKAPHCGAF
jgi:hypothetical protein